MRLGIVGSRRRNTPADKEIIRQRILELKPAALISGGCRKGADKFAEELAKELGIPITVFYPKIPIDGAPSYMWAKAFYDRNRLIAKNADRLLALVTPDRCGGTENTIKYFIESKGGSTNLEILE